MKGIGEGDRRGVNDIEKDAFVSWIGRLLANTGRVWKIRGRLTRGSSLRNWKIILVVRVGGIQVFAIRSIGTGGLIPVLNFLAIK